MTSPLNTAAPTVSPLDVKTVATALAQASVLSAVSDSPRLDVELLLQHVLERSRSYLFTWPEASLSDDQQQQFVSLLQRRIAGEPIAYLIGEQDFWTLSLAVSSATLIPRPDTEVLVEQALACLSDEHARVLDLGTGTGAVALALAAERPHWNVLGVDYVPDAVVLAQRNAERNQLTHVQFLQSDWFASVQGRFQVIVSNPPYIDPCDPHLDQGDVRFEPRSALVAEQKGLADIHIIIQQAPNYLLADGWLLLEHGYDQAQAVRQLLIDKGFASVTSARDIGGHERVSLGRWPLESGQSERED